MNSKFCGNICQGAFTVLTFQQKWLNNEYINLNRPWRGAKKFILEEQEYKCAICLSQNIWNARELIFVLDHIDGNSTNNARDNLRCVCPNCDSQLPTYKAKNKGNGRHSRRDRYKNGQSY